MESKIEKSEIDEVNLKELIIKVRELIISARRAISQ
jgi:hypothetical protein